MDTSQDIPKEGMKCTVFQDPITHQKKEGEAIITKFISSMDYKDDMGKPIYRCSVHFYADDSGYSVQRDISEFS
jgi:hypothetical protein